MNWEVTIIYLSKVFLWKRHIVCKRSPEIFVAGYLSFQQTAMPEASRHQLSFEDKDCGGIGCQPEWLSEA